MYLRIMKQLWLLTAICMLVASRPAASRSFFHNLDVVGGLPSNHIYGMLVDRNGYLWIATPEGVARYNGYEVKIFDVTNGLPTNDIWELYEDARGRIWLLSFVQSLGYIYNDYYREAYIRDSTLRIIPPPGTIRDYPGGVFLLNSSPVPGQPELLLLERNDTFQVYSRENGKKIRQLTRLWDVEAPAGLGRWLAKYDLPVPVRDSLSHRFDAVFFFDKYIICFSSGNEYLEVFNKEVGRWFLRRLDAPATSLRKIGSQESLFLLADTILYQLDNKLEITRRTLLTRSDLPISSLSWFAEGPPWGMCWGTAGKGVLVPFSDMNGFQPLPGDLSGYRHVGHSAIGKHYWWNERLSRFAIVDTAADQIYYKDSDRKMIRAIVPWNERYSLLISNNEGLNLLDNQTDISMKLAPKVRSQHADSGDNIEPAAVFRLEDLLLLDTTTLYLISRLRGLLRIDLERMHADFMMQQPGYPGNGTTYKGLVRDPVRKAVWAYGNTEGIVCISPDKAGETGLLKMRHPFLNGIEQVLIDEKYGNIFVRKADGLYMVDPLKGIVTVVRGQMNMHKSAVCLDGQLLVVAGRFGVSFFRILGPNRLSAPVTIENIKDRHYSGLISVHAVGNSILMNTDKGLIRCPVPDLQEFPGSASPRNHDLWLVVKDHRGARTAREGDTIFLDPHARSLQLDAVHPGGNGVPKYDYLIVETGARWQKSGSNELVVTDLQPGNFYTLQVQLTDNVRKYYSRIQLYVVPHWWETTTMRRLMVAAGLLALIGLTWLTVGITKRIMRKENFEKNLRMEMELKSIYAQINPHFIYNTLNSILLLIKTGNNNDAFYNVSKFSKLLRAYIKSSRNRYITVAEEVENLRNYIELQQVRFNGKFNYCIHVEDPEVLESLKIPSLLLQPLVENAINHGLFHKEGEPGMLNILFRSGSQPGGIICIIDDNGIGRRESERINQQSSVKPESYGSILIKDLIDILNRYEQANIHIEYVDKLAPDTGTIVKLYIR
jgi:hypothetical protein